MVLLSTTICLPDQHIYIIYELLISLLTCLHNWNSFPTFLHGTDEKSSDTPRVLVMLVSTEPCKLQCVIHLLDILDFHWKSTLHMVVDCALRFRNLELKNVFDYMKSCIRNIYQAWNSQSFWYWNISNLWGIYVFSHCL